MSNFPKRPSILSPEKRLLLSKLLKEEGLDVPQKRAIPRRSESSLLTLSFVQQQLWFIDQLEPGNHAYNIPEAIRLSGPLNVAVLERSLSEIVRRHEALRTTFAAVDGSPVQVIAPPANVALPVIDLVGLSESERRAETARLINEEVRYPFNLSHGLLFRARLLRLASEDHVLLLNMHHIISDGWSLGVFNRELTTLYEAFVSNQPSPLQELPIQYADYAVWQREWLESEAFEKQLAYWRKQLAGAPTVLNLPLDRPRPAVQSFQGARQFVKLPKSLSEELKLLSQREGVTLFMTLLAAFQILLARYTNQDDIVVGTDVANRNRVETEGLIGFFINNVVMRTNLAGDPVFREVLGRVKEMALGAYAHQDVPFPKLVEALKPKRSLGHTPLFQVLFVMQNAPLPDIKLTGLTLAPVEIDSGTSKFDVAVFINETAQGLIGTWSYKTDLFDCTTITRMAGHFTTLLEGIAEQPLTRVSALEMFTELERKQKVMEQRERQESQINKLRSVKRKTVGLSQGSSIKTSYLQPGETLPLVIQPGVEDMNLAEWAGSNRELIETELLKHGAILFRGFGVNSVAEFEQFAMTISPELFDEYGDLPRESVSGKIYSSTPYPADQAILFHNESSHMHRWPMKIWFYCVTAAQQGGETPIIDCRKAFDQLDPKIRERFMQKKVAYVRNYTDGLDVSWQEFFHTSDRSVVEDYCRKASIEFEWKDGNNLRTRQACPAVVKHPQTGEMLFFNQLQLHHISCLEPGVREALLSTFGEENLPRNVYYGDGTPIEDSVMEEIGELYRNIEVKFTWQDGDIIMLNNMMVAHSRSPFVGPRKIVVSMAEMVNQKDVEQ